jgi:hypothetical protein
MFPGVEATPPEDYWVKKKAKIGACAHFSRHAQAFARHFSHNHGELEVQTIS